MPTLTTDQIVNCIRQLFNRPNPLLFAGAGVGTRVGFPNWDRYIEHMANTCDQFDDAESAVLIRKRLEQRNHLGAATVFKTSTLIPEGERWKTIAEPFRITIPDNEIEKLVPLASLPFTGIVTTNYEHSLHDACAHARGRWVLPIERDNLRGASFSRELFVARIHGNAEEPTSMALDAGDYRGLREDDDYLDFLLNVLTSRSCLFLGFSFLDPAISHVLDVYADRFGPVYPALHTAIIPDGDLSLENRLRQLNIETFVYSSSKSHADLWRAIREAAKSIGPPPTTNEISTLNTAHGHGPIHRFVAFTYAQTRMRADAQPVAAVAQDGLVASVLSSQPDGIMVEATLTTEVATILRVTEAEAGHVVTSSLTRLIARDQILRDDSVIAWVGPTESELDLQLTKLARDVIDRACVREGTQPTDRDRRAAKLFLENVLMSRAWDIAAHFAGGNSGLSVDVRELVQNSIRNMPDLERPTAPATLERAIQDLICAPDSHEAEVLMSLGRAAFGIQLLLASPRQTLFHQQALPRMLYLDANVLLPAITTGHPLRPAYMDVIAKLAEAGEKARVHLTLAVGDQFLNEIVSHRRLAVEIVEAAGLEHPDNLRRHIQFYSTVNTNVYVGAYGTVVGRSGKKIRFADFLSRAAPFKSEDELACHLENLGIRTVSMDFRKEHNFEFVSVFSRLKQVYEDCKDLEGEKEKPSVLVQHEAAQLTQLLIDTKVGERSLFVTADRHLRRALLAHPVLRHLSGMTVSHLGLVALADVMVGLSGDARALARLVWATPAGEQEKALFDYFVTLGLREYQEGLATELQALAKRSTEEASETSRAERIRLFSKEPEDIAKTAAFLDRFQDRFYEYWHEAIRRRERD